MSLLKFARHPIAAVALSLLSVGCATNPDGSLKTNADGTYQMDDKAKGALMGAAAGCALAAVSGKDCVAGAVVGAVAGFLVSWYFESKKVAEASVVNKEYAKSKTKPPKNEIIPAAFTTRVEDSSTSASGEREVKVTSNTDLIGYGDKVPEMQQKYAIYDENNKLVEEKTEKLAAVDGAGRYQTTSKFKLPANAKGKKYTVKTTLASNTKTYKENTYKIAMTDDGQPMLLALAQ
jgi:hypothetical protein